jgi:hypothetical protein
VVSNLNQQTGKTGSKTMLNINQLVAGRIYSFIHCGEVATVGKRKFDGVNFEFAPDWICNTQIFGRTVFAGHAANAASYGNAIAKATGEAHEPSGKSWFHHAPQAGIVLHNTTGKPYLCALHPRVIKAEYFFADGTPLSDAQMQELARWKKSKSSNEDVKFFVFDLDKVQCTGEVNAPYEPRYQMEDHHQS